MQLDEAGFVGEEGVRDCFRDETLRTAFELDAQQWNDVAAEFFPPPAPSAQEPSGSSRHHLRIRTWVTASNHRRITAPHTRTFNHGAALVVRHVILFGHGHGLQRAIIDESQHRTPERLVMAQH